MFKILFATTNKGKMAEIREILSGTGIEAVSMEEAGVSLSITEDGATFKDNAEKKAAALARETGLPALSDDSGLEIDFLDNAPGVMSARFMGENTSYDIKNRQIIEMLEGVPTEKRTARFVCAIAAAIPGGGGIRLITEQAFVHGIIATEPVGENGFGYDPIFFIPEFGMTAAQMPSAQKNTISHRGKALRQILPYLKELQNLKDFQED